MYCFTTITSTFYYILCMFIYFYSGFLVEPWSVCFLQICVGWMPFPIPTQWTVSKHWILLITLKEWGQDADQVHIIPLTPVAVSFTTGLLKERALVLYNSYEVSTMPAPWTLRFLCVSCWVMLVIVVVWLAVWQRQRSIVKLQLRAALHQLSAMHRTGCAILELPVPTLIVQLIVMLCLLALNGRQL